MEHEFPARPSDGPDAPPDRTRPAEPISPATSSSDPAVSDSHIAANSLSVLLSGRLHPLTLLLGLITALRRLVIPAIPLLFFSNRIVGVLLLLLMSAGTIGTLLVRYFTFSYRIEGGELITKEGILERRERHIPLAQVQEIRLEQSVLQRVFDVVAANVETAGSQGAEATLSVLSRAEAERLRQVVRAHEARQKTVTEQAVPLAPPERTVLQQPGLGDLVLAGLTSNHLLSALAIAGTIWAFADDVLPESIYRRAGAYFGQALQQVLAQGTKQAVIFALLTLLAVFIIGMIFSVLGTIVLFYGYTLSRSGNDLYRSWGLLTRRASSLPRRRIQVLQVQEGMLRRWCGLATLRVDISGSKREGQDDNSGRDVLLPIVRRGELAQLLPQILPDPDTESAEWRRVSRLAVRRATLKGALVCLIAGLVISAWSRTWVGLWLLALVPLIYWLSVISYRHLGYTAGEHYFRTRRGWLGRSTHIVPVSKAQVIEIRQTPFDRRLRLATLSVDTAGQAYTGGGPQISNLPLEEAQALARTLAHKAAGSGLQF